MGDCLSRSKTVLSLSPKLISSQITNMTYFGFKMANFTERWQLCNPDLFALLYYCIFMLVHVEIGNVVERKQLIFFSVSVLWCVKWDLLSWRTKPFQTSCFFNRQRCLNCAKKVLSSTNVCVCLTVWDRGTCVCTQLTLHDLVFPFSPLLSWMVRHQITADCSALKVPSHLIAPKHWFWKMLYSNMVLHPAMKRAVQPPKKGCY